MSKEEILAAAIQLSDGRVVSVARPARHTSVILECEKNGWRLNGSVQGFVTTSGRFVDRFEAYAIAEQALQLLPKPLLRGKLYSEDVW